MNYIQEHEKNLKLQFSHLDRNKDGNLHKSKIILKKLKKIFILGKVDLDEMITVFKDMGIQMEHAEAAKLFNR